MMPFPFFLAGIIGKAAAGALGKGIAAKASAMGTKALVGSHGHHPVAQKFAGKVAEKFTDAAVDAALAKKEKKGKRDTD
jgi:hypothetical protein